MSVSASVDGAALGPVASATGPSGTALGGPSAWRRLSRAGQPALALVPFTLLVLGGLGVPVIAVINEAFRNNNGQLTGSNVSQATHGFYYFGLYNSVKLSLITSIIPGVCGAVIAYAIHTSPSNWLRRLTTTLSAVFANFGGVNLTFMFLASLSSSGILTVFLVHFGINLNALGFKIYTFYGVALVYMYFQIPLMVLVITPALSGLKPAWREAAQNMGASSWRYWRYVGVPVLLPSVLGGTLLLFGSSFAAYATAESLTAGTIALSPIQIGNLLNGNVISNEVHLGYAIALMMLLVLSVTMVAYGLLRRRTSRWLR
ncbi:MAG: ABC transporter permease [Acidimicrobiales bacterium]